MGAALSEAILAAAATDSGAAVTAAAQLSHLHQVAPRQLQQHTYSLCRVPQQGSYVNKGEGEIALSCEGTDLSRTRD